MFVYIGGYTERDGKHTGNKGIVTASLSGEGTLEALCCEPCANPSFLCIGPSGKTLFAAAEDSPSFFVRYDIRRDGSLSEASRALIPGGPLCHLALSEDGRFLAGAGYRTGIIAVARIDEDGTLADPAPVIRLTGKGITARQQSPHAHQIVFRDGRMYCCDLGTDEVRVFRLDRKSGALSALPSIRLPAGEGPRHLVFSEDGAFLYVITELGNHIAAFRPDKSGTSYLPLAVCDLVAQEAGDAAASEISVDPSGRYLFASVRFHDALVRFRLDSETGLLSDRTEFDCHGKTPRHFSFTPDGRFLLIANQDSDEVVCCRYDALRGSVGEKTGSLTVYSPTFAAAIE